MRWKRDYFCCKFVNKLKIVYDIYKKKWVDLIIFYGMIKLVV